MVCFNYNLHIEDLSVLMGRENAAILDKDGKALILLGIPAANKQRQILMNMEYQVTLLDYAFAVASKHS